MGDVSDVAFVISRSYKITLVFFGFHLCGLQCEIWSEAHAVAWIFIRSVDSGLPSIVICKLFVRWDRSNS